MDMDKKNCHRGMMGGYGGVSQESDYLAEVDAVAAERGEAAAEAGLDLPLGQRIRSFREHKGLSLTDLAQRTGFVEEFLAAVEAGKTSPPLGDLVKLGKALDMKLGTLLANGEERPFTMVRQGERLDMSRYPHTRRTAYGYTYQALAPEKSGRSMEPFFVTLTGGAEDLDPSTHDGQEFIFVLEGDMEVIIGDECQVLQPGDSIYYDSTSPHLLRPHGGNECKIVAVIHSGK